MSTIYYPSARVSLRVNFQSDPDNYELIECLPKHVKAEINSYQQADEFEIKLDYNVFPIDPRMVKSCGVGVWIGTTEKLGQLVENDPEKCIITGFVDDFDINLAEDDQTITIKGRDFTGVLLDNKWFHGNVPLDLDLEEAIKWILSKDPAFANIEVVNKTGKTLPVLSDMKLRKTEEHTPNKEDSYWDIIYDLCLQAGVICYIKLDKLIIQNPKNLNDDSKITNFVFGINLRDLRFRKKFGKNHGLNIEVRSYDPTTKQTLSAIYPDPPIDKKAMVIPSMNKKLNTQTTHSKPEKKTKTSGKSEKAGPAQRYEITTFVVSNIRDIEQLKSIAESIWNQMFRRQVEVEMTTHDLTAFDTQEHLTLLRNGDPVAVTIGEQFKKIINSMPYEQKLDFLLAQGFDTKVAKEIATSTEKLDKAFYIQKVRHQWDLNEGYSMDADLVNFINVPE